MFFVMVCPLILNNYPRKETGEANKGPSKSESPAFK